ncbi:MAG: hypothetical protein H0T89_30385 [Deltaproteobacteria bacterium]|nr:hypothetical protein [Deltaproteobacteria bacterium]MDQ3299675.1 hypothetical protein [Myxococcota bacterium]
MADVIAKPRHQRHVTSRLRRRRDDIWIATTALAAAMLALPFAQSSWHGPEVASVLAVAATALFAGQRWAIAVIVVAELLLMPTIWPRAFLDDSGAMMARVAALSTLVAIVPGILSMRRAAAALVLVTGQRRTRENCRRFHMGLVLSGLIATILPLL